MSQLRNLGMYAELPGLMKAAGGPEKYWKQVALNNQMKGVGLGIAGTALIMTAGLYVYDGYWERKLSRRLEKERAADHTTENSENVSGLEHPDDEKELDSEQ